MGGEGRGRRRDGEERERWRGERGGEDIKVKGVGGQRGKRGREERERDGGVGRGGRERGRKKRLGERGN